ncbi:MAG: tetratricopeptide repeat protein [Candidatus Omnitrophica bacterium]|nr:tetratricopeptide repeat protein [Candidatus Omnitrophota bacterium]
MLRSLFLCVLALLLFTNTRASAWEKRFSCALAHYIIAVMREGLGDLDSAIKEYKNALRLDYQSPRIHLSLGTAYLKKNNLSPAITELGLAGKFDPQAVEPHAILALIYSLQNKSQLASKEYEDALKNATKFQPKNVQIYKELVALYLKEKKFMEAKNICQLILDLSPADPETYFYLANSYDALGDRNAAITALKKSLELKPDYPEALNYLGYIYVEEERNLEQAEVMIKKALEIDPDNAAYIDSLGWLYFKQGRYKEALQELERAVSLWDDPVIYDHLGDVYFKAGEIEKAKLSWQKSLELDPKQQKVKAKIDGLPRKSN